MSARRLVSRLRTWFAVSLAVTGVLALTLPTPATAQPRATAPHPSCAGAHGGQVRCLSRWQASGRAHGKISDSASAAAGPAKGLRPADIRQIYQLPSTGGTPVIGIVDAYDNPKAEKNLGVYRAAFGLKACTTANKCFRKVDQRGGKHYPEGDPGWGVEINLDVQAVSAACPSCKILLVEADDPSFEAIGAAVNTAVRLGATVVSNSYGADEFASMVDYGRKYYRHAGVPILASSGDFGFGPASFPAVLSSTWAVGGTTVSGNTKRGFTEKAWEGAGSGCSAYIAKPSYQKDKNCQLRTVADISAVANAKDGFAVYDTYGLDADNGWIGVGGTSLSSPLVAGMIGLAKRPSTVAKPSYLYSHRSGLKDVVGGSNGYCGGDYLCTGRSGYDGPTGLGSPRGLSSLGGKVS
jgi:subtilase family serine protease